MIAHEVTSLPRHGAVTIPESAGTGDGRSRITLNAKNHGAEISLFISGAYDDGDDPEDGLIYLDDAGVAQLEMFLRQWRATQGKA